MIIPFYSSSSEAKKLDGEGKLFGVNEFFPFWGKGPGGWLNKTSYTWKGYPEETAIANNDRSKYYGSTKLRRIANELDALLPDAKAMIKQMEDQIPSSDSFRSVGAGRSRLITKLAAREYGVKDEEFNQGLIANGIVPTTHSRSADGKLNENIRKAKKIIGVDGPITYKLVPFESGRNFAYRPIPDKNLGRFFVLVDINPRKIPYQMDQQPVDPIMGLHVTGDEEEEEVELDGFGHRKYPIQPVQQQRRGMVGVGRR